ncbi:MAG: hypothetical protein ABI054_01675 [Planctomycetota bacterium]
MKVTRCGLRPSKPLIGNWTVPDSKSLAQRALIQAALSRETTLINGLDTSRCGADIQAAHGLIQTVGATLEQPATSGFIAVRGVAPGPLRGWRTETALDAGESGTLARLASAAAALCGDRRHPILIGGRGSLLARQSPALFAALGHAGARIEFLGRADGWPVWIMPVASPSELVLEAPSSSQEVSALLIAAAAWQDPIDVVVRGAIPSRPYLELTLRSLANFGVLCTSRRALESEIFRVHGPLIPPKAWISIEPDASAAAVLLAAACLTGGEVSVAGLGPDSIQGDVRIAAHLAAFGCRSGFDARGIYAGGAVQHGAHVHLSGEPDLAPVLAAVAAAAALQHGARSRLTGLDTLQGKESPRIDVLRNGLSALGLKVSATDTTMTIAPGLPTRGPLLLDPRGDHRMAFAFALLGLLRDDVDVLEPDCVAKSWPGFWPDIERAGASLARATS